MTITLRNTKGSPLTHAELDENFTSFASTADGEGDALVGVKSTQTDAVGTTQHEVNERVRSVFDFMTAAQRASVVARDYSEDVTTALQTAITQNLTGTGGGLYWPDGGYKITDELTIPSSAGWKMFGQSRLGTTIKQYTDNKRIFRFAVANSHSFSVTDFEFDYSAQQASSNTAAIPLSFMSDSGTATNGFYNYELGRLTFKNCWYCISGNPSNQTTVWGGNIHDLYIESTVTGGVARLTQSSAQGQPNNRFQNVYVRADDCENTLFDFQAVHNTEMDNIEVVNNLNGVGVLKAIGGSTIKVGTWKCEIGTYTTSGRMLFELQDSILHMERFALGGVHTFNPGGGNKQYIFRRSGGTSSTVRLGVLHITSGSVVSSGSLFIMDAATTTDRWWLGHIHGGVSSFPSGCTLTDNVSTASSEVVWVESWGRGNLSPDKGDADYTYALGDPTAVRYSTTLTANRTVTLPASSGAINLFAGLKIKVIRDGVGDFRLDVVSGSTLDSFPPNTLGTIEFIWRRSAWTVGNRSLRNAVGADVGDAAKTLTVGQASVTQVWNTALGADRAVTLSTTGAKNGDKWHIVRTAASTGVSNLNVGTGPLKALATGTWCDVEYNGSAWVLSAYGAL